MNRVPSLRVMTRNIYLGADIERVVAAVGDPVTVGRAMLELRDTVAATDFGVRARLLAAEIAATAPDVIGLQEAAIWRERATADGEEVVAWDFLALLLDELASRGCEYAVAVASDRADLAVPTTAPVGESAVAAEPTESPVAEVRLTMRDVILVRGGLEPAATGQGRYDTNLSFEVAGLVLAPERGFQWIDLTVGEWPVRVVNTHLESLSADLTLAQAEELHRGLPTDRAVVVVGDFNSDPLDSRVRDGATAGPSAAYHSMLAAGFRDAWEERPGAVGNGWTACLGELLDEPSAEGFDHRLDFVFVRAGEGGAAGVEAAGAVLTGNTLDTRDPATGLWASDHAGVVVTLTPSA